MHIVGKIDKKIYSCITEDIVTDEVIITDERIAHIKERHPDDYEKYYSYLQQILEDPDYILESKTPDTAFILKLIEENGKDFQLILRLKTSCDLADYKNSIITFLKIDRRKKDKYLRNKKILYSRE